ncbi:MAG: GvpL/GvpF family gas vesicle protein [Gemmatimonadota bacterium]
MALTLYGVTVNDTSANDIVVADVELIAIRDLAAICGIVDYKAAQTTEPSVDRHAVVVSTYSARGPVLPAPVGAVFRTHDAVRRWLELHYSALTGAMVFVENRVAGRVHIWRPGPEEEREAGADLAAIAAESLRVLRRSAVATVPLRVEKLTGVVLSAAFLVEEELWKEFVAQVAAQKESVTGVRFELTGPWPPYDFIQMQLGS